MPTRAASTRLDPSKSMMAEIQGPKVPFWYQVSLDPSCLDPSYMRPNCLDPTSGTLGCLFRRTHAP